MPATAERPRPVPIPAYDPPRRRSPPPTFSRSERSSAQPQPSVSTSHRSPVPQRDIKSPSSPAPEKEPIRAPSPEAKPPLQPELKESTSSKDTKEPTKPEPEESKEPESADGEPIDMEIFQQILELDDEDDGEFSRGMVEEFFAQASTTFKEMDAAYTVPDLGKLHQLGHFLKGSSAALGVWKVQQSCEKIQHYGQLRDAAGVTITSEDALKLIDKLLIQVKVEYREAEKWLRNFYSNNP